MKCQAARGHIRTPGRDARNSGPENYIPGRGGDCVGGVRLTFVEVIAPRITALTLLLPKKQRRLNTAAHY